jgi:hypothetical protein
MMNQSEQAHAQIDLDKYEAAIFDMDGVVTETARAHNASWKRMFDAYLKDRTRREGETYKPFEDDDYYRYVDGNPRYEGAASFLESRGIDLPYGSPDDAPDKETVCGLGNRKNKYFHEYLKENGADFYESTVEMGMMACCLWLNASFFSILLFSELIDKAGTISENMIRSEKRVTFIFHSLLSQVLIISDLFLPDDVLAIEDTGYDQVGHGRVGCGAMPMIDVGRAPDGVAGFEGNNFSIPRSGQAYTGGHDHMLSGRMQMPCGSGAGLKGDICP